MEHSRGVPGAVLTDTPITEMAGSSCTIGSAGWVRRAVDSSTFFRLIPHDGLRASRASPCLPCLDSALDLGAPPLGRLSVAVFVVPVPPRIRRGLRVAR